MDDRRALLAMGVVALVAVLAAGWWFRPPVERRTMPRPAPIPEATDPLAAPVRAPRRSAPAGGFATPHEEALMAALDETGEALLRCDVPDGLEGFGLDNLNWAGLHEGRITLAASDVRGTAPLYPANPEPKPLSPPRPADTRDREQLAAWRAEVDRYKADMAAWQERWLTPLAVVSWTHARPGAEGDCTITPTQERQAISVRVTYPDGQPFAGASVSSLGEKGLVKTDALGLAQVQVWAGVPSLVDVFGRDPDGRWSGSRFVTAPPDRSVEVLLRPREPSPAPRTRDEMMEAIETRSADHDAPLMRALERDDLSPEARAQLEAWLAKSAEGADQALDVVDRLAP